ncbi:MAG: glycosyltransferase family 2 protein [Hyphomicrobiaceae bacterium]
MPPSTMSSNKDAAARRLAVSCFIIAKNEADRLPRAIASVRDLVDEIVVIDSGSTDQTVAIAEALGARVLFNPWSGFGQQKRFGEQQCRNAWLLNIDADEEVSDRLAGEIRRAFAAGEPAAAAFGMWASIVYPGDTKPRPLARDHFVYRLYDKRRVRFADSALFDSVQLEGHRGHRFKGALLHHTVRSMDDLIAKSNARAAYNAGNAKRKSRLALAVRLVTEFPLQFLRYYFARAHVLGGMKGFQYATIIAFFRFVRILHMYEERQSAGATADPNAPHSRHH